MKFNFKIQQYQTDAVEAVVRVFNGQPHYDKVSYIRDLGQPQAKQHIDFNITDDEDDVQPGDVLILMEWENGEYTGRTEVRRIRYVLRDVPEYGLMPGYCIIGW